MRNELEQQPQPLLKVSDVSTQLGISRTSIYRFINAGELTPVRIGRSIRFRPSEVERFIDSLKESK